MDHVDAIVVGAGVVGLAIGKVLADAGKSVIVLEREACIGSGISSRNSEVIHAGLYYPSGSLKASLCRTGRELLYSYLAERGIPFKNTGKLVVATGDEQDKKLKEIYQQARRNACDEVELISASEAIQLEPVLHCTSALLSPRTGIVDSHQLMLALQGDIESYGGVVALSTEFLSAEKSANGIRVRCTSDFEILTDNLIISAGLDSSSLAARISEFPRAMIPETYYAKGNYYSLLGKSPFSRLIYPIPEPGGLGIHLTLDLGGRAKFGPNVEWVQDINFSVTEGLQPLFATSIASYWPGVSADRLVEDYAGIRPKLSGPSESATDFRILFPKDHQRDGVTCLFGIESPGLTSCLAIARYVYSRIFEEN